MRARPLALIPFIFLTVGFAVGQVLSKGSGHAPQTFSPADVEKALNDAEQFRRDGKYEKSLERHIWYHENALRYAPAQSGVRLSFALDDWAGLAKEYPKALDALKATRNKALAAYGRGFSNGEAFDEAMSIDLAIDDLKSTKALFYEGKKHGTPSSLSLDLDRIVATGDFKWAKNVIGDPNKALQEIISEHELSRSAGQDKHVQGMVDGLFATQAATLIQAVAKVYGLPTARKIQKLALKHMNSQEIKDAIK